MKKKILKELYKRKGEYVSSSILSSIYSVTRTTIWKYINELKVDGYHIEASSNKGYKLLKYQSKILINDIENKLNTQIVGRKIEYFDEIDSTNDECKRIAQKPFLDGTVVIANKQNKGKGRLGRVWYSDEESGIWMSIILKPNLLPQEIQIITLATSIAVVKTINKIEGIKAGIKWPNDILINNKKVCGILTEMSAEVERINYVVVGIGINVKQKPNEFKKDIKDIAISLEGYLSQINNYEKLNRNDIIRRVLFEFEKIYTNILDGGIDEIVKMWREYSITLGKEVIIVGSESKFSGKAIDITKEGKLVVKINEGDIREFNSGEICIK